ncbi:MAG: YceI family protein [Phycisphaeraceae bacterium]
MQATALLLATATVLAMSMCAYDGGPTASPSPEAAPADREQASSSTTFSLADASRIRLAGSATIGSWDCIGQTAQAAFTPGASVDALRDAVDQVEMGLQRGGAVPAAVDLRREHTPRASLNVRIDSLGCGNAAMERDMHDALKADEHPEIRYELDEVADVQWSLGDDGERGVFVVDTLGRLSLAGHTETIEMQVRVERVGPGRYTLLGRKQIDMKTFGIEPPSALFGLIRADPQVTVVFDLVVEPERVLDEPSSE